MLLQVIAGPGCAVNNLFGAVACDSRHQHIQVIGHRGSEKRIFRAWSLPDVTESGRPGAPGSLFPRLGGECDIIAISLHRSAMWRHLLGHATDRWHPWRMPVTAGPPLARSGDAAISARLRRRDGRVV